MNWDEAPFYPRGLVGWKALKWRKKYGYGEIVSPHFFQYDIWHDKSAKGQHALQNPVRARCIQRWQQRGWTPHSDDPPIQDCDCGLWAYASLEAAASERIHQAKIFRVLHRPYWWKSKEDLPEDYFAALVLGTGRAFVNELTWRSEYQEIVAVIQPSALDEEQLGELLGLLEVPLLDVPEAQIYARELKGGS